MMRKEGDRMKQTSTPKTLRRLSWLYNIFVVILAIYIGSRLRIGFNTILSIESGYVVGAIMLFFTGIMLTVGKNNLVAKTRWLTFVSGIGAALFMYIGLGLLISDGIGSVLHLFIKDEEIRETMFVLGEALTFVSTLLLMLYGMCKAHRMKRITYEVYLKNSKVGSQEKRIEPYKMILISDLHIGHYIGESHIQKVVQAINQWAPDIVVIAGDLINDERTRECKHIDEVAKVLAQIKSKEGVYAVLGNHDPLSQDEALIDFLSQAKIKLLEDEIYINQRFNLIGRTAYRMNQQVERKSLHTLLEQRDGSKPSIVLDHDPIGIDEAVHTSVDLVLCGHTHKGQLFPLNLFAKLAHRGGHFWGFSKQGTTQTIVTSGAGYFSIPMRIGSSNEVVQVMIYNQ